LQEFPEASQSVLRPSRRRDGPIRPDLDPLGPNDGSLDISTRLTQNRGMRGSWQRLGLLSFAVIAAGCGSASTVKSSTPEGAKTGSFNGDHCGAFGGCTEDSARKKLDGSDVWCVWRGGRVHAHVVLHNGLNAHVTVNVSPDYSIKDGGDHGDSFGSDVPIGIGAQATVSADIDAGAPEGVPPNAEVSKCSPKLQDIDITNPGSHDVSGDRVVLTSSN
jgi:hypothetical protein